MGQEGYDNLNSMHFDVLKEIGSIGSGNAATALSSILNKPIKMKVPKVNLLEFKHVADVIGGAENIVIGLLVKLSNDVEGIMMFIMEQQSAFKLVNSLMHRNVQSVFEMDEMDISAVQEIGNIMTSAYLSALATLTGLKIGKSVPYISIDMAGAILSVPAIEFGKVGDRVLFIESLFGGDADSVSGYFLLVPEVRSFEKIMHSLGVM